jgi:hypothetical protein
LLGWSAVAKQGLDDGGDVDFVRSNNIRDAVWTVGRLFEVSIEWAS